MPMEKMHDYLFKIILIGDSGVGKTSIMKRYTDEIYTANSASTIGVDFKIKTVMINNKKVKLQIWDTAGQERFKAIVSHYYRGAHGIMLVFDMVNRESFLHLKDWMDELKKRDVPKTTQIRILGNKIDCKENLNVSKVEIDEFLKTHGIPLANFSEVSAQDDVNVEQSFITLTSLLVETHANMKTKVASKLVFKNKEIEKKGWCC